MLIVSKSGWMCIIPAKEIYVYPGSGRGRLIDFPNRLAADVLFASAVNVDSLNLHLATNKGRKVHKTINLSAVHENVFRIIEVTRGESVSKVKIK